MIAYHKVNNYFLNAQKVNYEIDIKKILLTISL